MSDKEGNFIEVKTWLNTRVLSKQSYQSDFPEILKNKQDLFSFQIEGQSSIASIIPETSVQAKIGWIDGLYFGKWGIERKSSETDIMRIYIHSMKRLELSDNEYLINKNQWSTGKWNNMIHLEFIQKPAFLGEEGGIKLGIGSNSLFTDFDYNFANAEIKSNFAFSDWGLRSRFFVQFGSGTSIAPESSLYLSGGNPSQMMDSPVYRSAGIIPDAWGGFGQAVQHAHFGGGLNLRGFSGLALSEIQNGQAVEAYRGTSGLSLNLEFEFQDLVGIKKEQLKRRTGLELSTYSFLDFGILGAPSTTSKLRFFQAKMDWGLGAALKINSLGGFYNFQAFTIRADFPLFISETVQENDQAFAFRWMLAIGRAF